MHVAWALVVSLALAPGPEARLKAILDRLRGPSHEATYTIRVVRPNAERSYRLKVYTDGRRARLRVLEPVREAGQAFLSLEGELYLYDPRLGRTLRLPPTGRAERFLGSDLTYQDLMGRDLEEQFSVAEEREALVLVPKPGAPTPYGRVEVYLREELPERLLYYDQRGAAIREVRISGYTRHGAAVLPGRVEVRDLLRSGYRTVVEVSEVRVGPVPERCFNPLSLERGCP